MSLPAERLLTYDDLLAADPGHGARPELWEGRLWYRTAPRPTHSRLQGRVAGRLDGLDPDEPGDDGWWIMVEPDWLIGPGKVLRPDLGGWRRVNLPELPAGAIRTRPDWVCEAISPDDPARDRVVKRAIYAELGVPYCWIIDPEGRTLEAFRLVDGQWLLEGSWTDGAVVRIPPFEELELKISSFFTPLPREEG